MTITPLNSPKPIKKFQRFLGVFIGTVGVLMLLSTLTLLIFYCAGHNNSQEASWATFTNEFGYWGPVLIFCVPGLLLVFHGKRMMRCTSVSLLELVEVLAAIVTTIAIFLLVLR